MNQFIDFITRCFYYDVEVALATKSWLKPLPHEYFYSLKSGNPTGQLSLIRQNQVHPLQKSQEPTRQ